MASRGRLPPYDTVNTEGEYLDIGADYCWLGRKDEPDSKQYAIIAPMNTMADNIGGNTMHSFGRIPFKDRIAIQATDVGQKFSSIVNPS